VIPQWEVLCNGRLGRLLYIFSQGLLFSKLSSVWVWIAEITCFISKLHSFLWPLLTLLTRKTQSSQNGSRGGLLRWSEGWRTSPMKKGWGNWACLAWRREGSGETVFQYLKGAYRQEKGWHFAQSDSDRTRGSGFKQKEGRFMLDVRKKFFYLECDKALDHVSQRGCGWSISGGIKARQDGAAWFSCLVALPMVGGAGTGWFLSSHPT